MTARQTLARGMSKTGQMNAREEEWLTDESDSEEPEVFSSFSEVQMRGGQRVKREYYVVPRANGAISHWWRSLQIFSFFMVFVSGITVCISLGRLRTSFSDFCILYGDIYLLEGANITGDGEIDYKSVQFNQWGNGCQFAEYAPMFGASTAVLLMALFLMCGKGPPSKRMSVSESWKLVVPVVPFVLTFFIVSCVCLAYTVGGLIFFCSNIINKSHESLRIESCPQVFHLKFPYRELLTPMEISSIDRYSNFLLAEIGASLNFVGWFLALFILGIRCYLHADFVVVAKVSKVLDSSPSDQYLPLAGEDKHNIFISDTKV